MQKIKQKLHERKERKEMEREGGAYGTDTYGTTGMTETYGTTGMATTTTEEVPVAVGVAEVPVVITEEQHHTQAAATTVGEEVCGQKTFTEVEDRPVVKEQVTRYVEHHPVEKQFVVETRYVGEKPVASSQGVTHIGTEEYVVEAAEAGPKCTISAGAAMDSAMPGATGAGVLPGDREMHGGRAL